jgi:hypothetical protein
MLISVRLIFILTVPLSMWNAPHETALTTLLQEYVLLVQVSYEGSLEDANPHSRPVSFFPCVRHLAPTIALDAQCSALAYVSLKTSDVTRLERVKILSIYSAKVLGASL